MSFISDRFYKRDKKEYQLENNQGFINWLRIMEICGLRHHEVKDMQGLIDYLNYFYHLKYPDDILEDNSNLGESDVDITVQAKLPRLSSAEKRLMECEYGREVNRKWTELSLYDKRNEQDKYTILFDSKRGIIIDSTIKSFANHSLETILQYLKTHSTYLDYHELEEVINEAILERVLRYRLLQLTVLKILYTSSNPDIGLKRAKMFIKEMNEEFVIELSTKEIDLINQKYEEDKKTFEYISIMAASATTAFAPKGPKILKMSTEKRIYTD